MRRPLLLAGCAAAIAAAIATPAHAGTAVAPMAHQLGMTGAGPRVWAAGPVGPALQRLARTGTDGRQLVRWDYARSLIASQRMADALGVLDVMLQDEPDLGLSGAFQLAYGRVLVELGRGAEAIAALDRPGLIDNAEACAWRLRAFELAGADDLARRQMACARSAIVSRTAAEREAFLVPAARAAIASGRPDAALHWLSFVLPASARAAVVRGQALLAAGNRAAAAAQFRHAERTGTPPERAEAELGLVRAGIAGGEMTRTQAIEALARLTYRWRGDPVERHALLLSFELSHRAGDPRSSLRSAATLLRYHAVGAELPMLLGQSQATLSAMLSPGSRTPLEQAAGLYWEYRDLAPGGQAGDLLALGLADRLQEAGLYARAADLLEHQLVARARDVAQGPLSVRVAKLHILAGRPQRALDAIRNTSATLYPLPMAHDRQRVEAVALQLLGHGGEALAILQSVPGSGALQAELLWKQRSWAALADLMGRNLPPSGALSEPRQAMILRQAITLGMLGREEQLAALRARYSAAFAGLPTWRAFDMLTRPAGTIDAETLTGALAAIPAVSPAGELADLLDAAPLPKRRT